MTYQDNEFGRRNRERPNFDRPAGVHFTVKAWIMAGMAAIVLIGTIMWAFDGDHWRAASLNDPNTGAVTRSAPAPAAPGTSTSTPRP